jgi:hypothetical protein
MSEIVTPATLPSAKRYHWLNTIVGVLDGAFYLTVEEQFAVAHIIGKLLDALRIPDRSVPAHLPMPVVQEMFASYYSIQLEETTKSFRPVRPITSADCVSSIEAWRSALEDMVTTAYPDLSTEERMLLAKVLNDLLAAIGVPNRAPAYFPDAVLKAHRELDDF